jgi:phenylacetate-coenzyme A ligase PaaK-like adenylate-forming protein
MILRSGSILDPATECETPAARRARLGARLAAIVAHAHARAPRVRRDLEQAGLAPAEVRGLDDLARLPIVRKDGLVAAQEAEPPFGGLAAVEAGRLARVFMSPGPIFDPQGTAGDFWRFRHGYAAAGFRAGDVVLCSASYHLTPLGFMLDNGCRALGCAVIPGGVGQTEQQLKAASHLGATGYTGTPSFLFQLLTKARETGVPLALEVAWVIAEMLPESLRADIEGFGVRCLQGYGTADLGCIAYECTEKGGWHLHPDCIVEVLDLETGREAAPGQAGELTATIFDEDYPLIRFATGDIVTLSTAGACACGRTTPKVAGLLGRVGDAVKVKGMFVRASQMEKVVKGFPEAGRFRAVVTREQHVDRLEYEVEAAGDAALVARLTEALQAEIKVRGEVRLVPPGSLPAGSKKLDDRRVWK